MNVSSFDSNTGDWNHEEWTMPVGVTPGPEMALTWLCEDNQRQEEDEGNVCGPVRFGGEKDRFVLVSAWSGGRQWFFVMTVFSKERLSDEVLEGLLVEHKVQVEEEEEG